MEDFHDTTDVGAEMHTYDGIWPVLHTQVGWRVVSRLAPHAGGTLEDSCDYAGNWRRSLSRIDYSPISSLTPLPPPPLYLWVQEPRDGWLKCSSLGESV